MHIDESKKFDKRNIERNIKDGLITLKDYEIHLSRLTDSSDKMLSPEEDYSETGESESSGEGNETSSKKKVLKKKSAKGS